MSRSPAGNSQLPLLLLVILAATACGKSPPKQAGDADSVAMEQGNSGKAVSPAVPKDLVPIAFAEVQTYCKSFRQLECRDYKIVPSTSGPVDVTPADRANGIEERWCVSINFVGRKPGQPWQDSGFERRYTKRAGAWHVEQLSDSDRTMRDLGVSMCAPMGMKIPGA